MYAPEAEQEVHLRDYWRIAVKRKWIIISLFVIIVTTVTISSFKMTPIYRATTQLLIEKENPNVVSIKEVMAIDRADTDYYQTQHKILQSRSLAKKTIQTLKLKDNKAFNPQEPPGLISQFRTLLFSLFSSNKPKAIPEESAEDTKLIDRFLGMLTIEPVRNSRLVKVSFDSPDPILSSQVANTLAQLYIEQNLEIKFKYSEDASIWLNNNLARLRKKLEESEQALQRYKEKENIISLEERQNIVLQRLEELNKTALQAKTDRIGLETMYKRLQEVSGSPDLIESLPAVINNPLIQELKTAYAQEQRTLSELSQRYRAKHPNIIRQREKVEMMRKKIASEIAKITRGIETEYRVAKAREETLQQALDQAKKEAQELNQKAIQLGVLQREVESNRQIFETFLKRFKETSVTSDLRTSNIRVIDKAEIPLYPIKPRKKLNILLAMVVGLTLGVGLAFFFEYLDNTIKTPEDIEHYFKLPFLGLVGHFATNPSSELPTLHEPRSGFAEAFRHIRTNILFTAMDRPVKTLLITSASMEEGKTVITANIAIALAQMDKKVLLVDADIRKPRIHRLFDLKNTYGLTNLLLNGEKNYLSFYDTPISSLKLLTTGPIPPNPAEVIGSPGTEKFLAWVQDEFDYIVFDSPPIMSVTDPVILARLMDGVIIVVKAGVSTYPPVQRSIQQLQAVSARLLGIILNDVQFRKDSYYYQYYYRYYHYGYSQEEQKGKKKIGI
jgi:capsular exopolysaccharide synthesis family protein